MSSAQSRKPLTWLVTGCSNGLGLALARQVLASGDNLIATSRNPAKTRGLVSEIESRPNGKWVALDVTWPAEKIAEVVSGTAERLFGGVDVLVNNAAYSVLGALEDVPEETARAQFETNFWGALRVCRAVIPGMRDRGSGTIVNVSSVLGTTTFPACGMYASSKWALEGMSQSLAQEVESFGIRVLIPEFGSFRTGFLAPGAMQETAPSGPYRQPHVVGRGLDDEHGKDGTQPGDPAKGVKILYDVVAGREERLNKVLRLPLGSDCWPAAVAQWDRNTRDYELAKELAVSTDLVEG